MHERAAVTRRPLQLSMRPIIAVALLLAVLGLGLTTAAGRGGEAGLRALASPRADASPIRPPVVATGPVASPRPTLALPAGPVAGRVGLQVGHWRADELPDELALLRSQLGGEGGGYREVDINYTVASQVAALLGERGVTVDLLPATVPPGYAAEAFVAIHCDVNNDSSRRGFKLTRYGDSVIATRDESLVALVAASYGAATGQPADPEITRAMRYYYAFNGAQYRHAIDPATPAAIVELGFLTNPADRLLLTTETDVVAHGLAAGILRFLLGER